MGRKGTAELVVGDLVWTPGNLMGAVLLRISSVEPYKRDEYLVTGERPSNGETEQRIAGPAARWLIES